MKNKVQGTSICFCWQSQSVWFGNKCAPVNTHAYAHTSRLTPWEKVSEKFRNTQLHIVHVAGSQQTYIFFVVEAAFFPCLATPTSLQHFKLNCPNGNLSLSKSNPNVLLYITIWFTYIFSLQRLSKSDPFMSNASQCCPDTNIIGALEIQQSEFK